jgi:hypothetical protein
MPLYSILFVSLVLALRFVLAARLTCTTGRYSGSEKYSAVVSSSSSASSSPTYSTKSRPNSTTVCFSLFFLLPSLVLVLGLCREQNPSLSTPSSHAGYSVLTPSLRPYAHKW